MSDRTEDTRGAPVGAERLASASSPSRKPIREDGEAITTLEEAVSLYFSKPGPRRIAAYAAAAWGARIALGRPRASDVATCAAVAAWWPLQEWLAHKYLLHLEPREGRIDPLFAKRHRAHHVEPREIDLTLLPIEVLDAAMPANVALWLLAFGPRRTALTGIAAYATMALVYEWTHFIVHTGYKPKSELAKKIRRYHRLHHYRNENNWLGFTLPWVDEVLGTAPDPRSVPFSKTARDLFGLRAKAAGSSEDSGS